MGANFFIFVLKTTLCLGKSDVIFSAVSLTFFEGCGGVVGVTNFSGRAFLKLSNQKSFQVSFPFFFLFLPDAEFHSKDVYQAVKVLRPLARFCMFSARDAT
jgi:hypothetical protein